MEEARHELPGAPFGGARFPVEARLAGKPLGRFHLDVGLGDLVGDAPETLVGDDLLAFAGIPPVRALAVPSAQQFAEKLHAYTTPWTGRTNTRTKDLVDLVVLLERGSLDASTVARAVHTTFQARRTHSLPDHLQAPPAEWEGDFAAMALQVTAAARTLDQAHMLIAAYFQRLRHIAGEGHEGHGTHQQ